MGSSNIILCLESNKRSSLESPELKKSVDSVFRVASGDLGWTLYNLYCLPS